MAKKKRPEQDRGPGKKKKAPALEVGHSPQAQARLLLEQAMEAEPDQQKALAEQALQLDPDLAEVHLFLGRSNPVRREVLAHYRQALAAAERRVGPEALQQSAGRLGQVPGGETVLEAHQALAHLCWSLGRRDDAIQHAREVLRLEAGDPMTVRYTLAGWLLAQDRDADVERLLEQYPEDSTVWNWTKALLAFRKDGDSEQARKLLKKALKSNKDVVTYLLQEELPDPEAPEMYLPGSPEEAMQYALSFLSSWRAAEGAIAWLKEQTGGPKGKKATAAPAAQGPTPASKKALARLPQTESVWQVDSRQLSTWVEEQGREVRPWFVLVHDVENQLILGTETMLAPPSAEMVWDILARSMSEPLAGSAGRPAEIVYPARQPWQALEAHFQELGIRFQPREHLEESDALFQELNERMSGKPEPGLLDVPGVTPELGRHFYEGAAPFYRQAPWRLTGYESAVEIRCSKFQSGPWYAVVMGQSGMTIGLALYEDVGLLRRLWAEPASSETNARRTVATTVTFGSPAELPIADLDAGREHGWPVARGDAYPHVFHKERGMSTRPPLAWELELMEACLRALPDFIRRRPQDDTTPEEVTVPAGDGQLTLTLSWIEDEPPPAPKPRKRRRKAQREQSRDDLLEIIQDQWATIREAYDEFEEEGRPIILVDLQEEEVMAYPFEEFMEDLGPDDQARLQAQYEHAGQNNQMVVFVMDHANERLVSYSLDLD